MPPRYAFVLHAESARSNGDGSNRKVVAMKLRIGIPKGSLQEATLQLFARAGLTVCLSVHQVKTLQARNPMPAASETLSPQFFGASPCARWPFGARA